ncbi:MAG: RNA binding S1 domain protein [candidate division CPR1 bacterium GW2011_GWA2_42_17]|uniref:RNA binding S1 domain protein n=1 Tax=candidate division CPR1 bacterium GW2011_GWA2_42_17 TaxID=1618341 RepID=A0A0G0Z632_9BACT|nr:MAG: RNA binding S1 domain protein [candidate division CPR1 bacterium GW2011_GWA2_42_17]
MLNNGHGNDQDVDFFDSVDSFLPPVKPGEFSFPFFGRQYDGVIVAITVDGYFVENYLEKHTFLLPFNEAKAAGYGDLQVGQPVVIFSTELDRRTDVWLSTCHPLFPDDKDLAFVQRAVETGDWVEVKVSGQNARGLRLVYGTIGGFMFFENVDWERHRKNGSQPNLIGQTMVVRITSCIDYRGLPCFYASERLEEPVYDRNDDLTGSGDLCSVQVGEIVEGTVTGLKPYGVFVNIDGADGLISIAEIANRFIVDVEQEFTIGERVTVKVLSVSWSDEKSRWHIALSRKALLPAPILVESFGEPFEFDE